MEQTSTNGPSSSDSTTTGPASVLTCPSCAKQNRIRPSANGVPHCGSCSTTLPWVVNATDATRNVTVTFSSAGLDAAILSAFKPSIAATVVEAKVGGKPHGLSRLYRSAWGRGSQDAYRALRRLHDALRPLDPEFAISDDLR